MTDQQHDARRRAAEAFDAATSRSYDGAAPAPSGVHTADDARARAGAAADRGPGRKRWWLLALIALVAIAALLLGLSRCGADRAAVNPPAAPAAPSAAVPEPSVPAVPAAPAAPGVPDAQAPDATAPTAVPAAGSLTTSDGTSLLSAVTSGGGSLAGLVGKTVSAKAVPVQSVPADEGFWVGPSATDRVWVQLKSQGESAIQIKPGQLLDLSGTVVGHGADFTRQQAVTAGDGAEQLTREAGHVEADPNQVKIVGTR